MPHQIADYRMVIKYDHLNPFFVDYTRGIRRGSMFVRTAAPATISTIIECSVELPTELTPIEFRGIVHSTVSIAQASDAHPAGMSVDFLFDSAAQRQRVHVRVEQLIRRELGDAAALRLLGDNA